VLHPFKSPWFSEARKKAGAIAHKKQKIDFGFSFLFGYQATKG
jgi:hypothetical protein